MYERAATLPDAVWLDLLSQQCPSLAAFHLLSAVIAYRFSVKILRNLGIWAAVISTLQK